MLKGTVAYCQLVEKRTWFYFSNAIRFTVSWSNSRESIPEIRPRLTHCWEYSGLVYATALIKFNFFILGGNLIRHGFYCNSPRLVNALYPVLCKQIGNWRFGTFNIFPLWMWLKMLIIETSGCIGKNVSVSFLQSKPKS